MGRMPPTQSSTLEEEAYILWDIILRDNIPKEQYTVHNIPLDQIFKDQIPLELYAPDEISLGQHSPNKRYLWFWRKIIS